MNENALETLFEAGAIVELDLAFGRLARRLSKLEGEASERLGVIAAMLSRACASEKSTRLSLDSLTVEGAAKLFSAEELDGYGEDAKLAKEALAVFEDADARLWLETLKAAGDFACSTKEAAKTPRPLVFDEAARCVYPLRLWQAERRVAEAVRKLASSTRPLPEAAKKACEKLFPLYGAPKPGEKDLQRLAAETVASGDLSIITGGPGTGKTSSAAAALCALLSVKPDLKIELCAPTGKAAAQLLQSLNSQKELLRSKGASEALLSALPQSSQTIHRLLRWSPSQERYLKGADDKLSLDVLLVDEASMMPLSQADSLLAALPEGASLTLLGDKDQLASVESGSVFADLCSKSGPEEGAPFVLAPRVAELKKVHRFAEGGSIAVLKDAVNAQDADEAWRILSSEADGLRLIQCRQASKSRMREALRAELKELFDAEPFKDYLQESEPEKAFALFDSFRTLCSNRRGVHGTEEINATMLELAFGKRASQAMLKGLKGTPVIVTRNSYSAGLRNGDVGVFLPSGASNAAFFRDDAGEGGPAFKSCPLPLLPEHEPAFAMTVHKAQGSGFKHALLVLPPDPDNPLLTKELLYTGITRAKERLTIICSEESFKAATRRRTERSSGLAEALRHA